MQELAGRLNKILQDNQASKQRALDVMRKLKSDSYLDNAKTFYQKSLDTQRSYYLLPDVLNFLAYELRPTSYLEIGVRLGRSMAQMVAESPSTDVYGFDMLQPNYAGQPNPGPEFVSEQMKRAGARKMPVLISGNSSITVPYFFKTHPYVDVITVDGDHTYIGAKRDLDNCFPNLAAGGVLIFDDLYHEKFPELAGLWDEFKSRYSDHLFIEGKTATGTAIAIRPPFGRYEDIVNRFN